MKCYEGSNGKEVLLLLSADEGKEILLALEAYSKANKRKRKLSKIVKQLDNEFAVF